MRILVISQYFYPENFRINELCFNLAKRGHSVTVLTGYPNYPEGYIYNEYKGKKITEEIINRVNVLRVNLCQRRKNKVSLIMNYLSFMFNATMKIKKIDSNFDIIFVFEVSPVTQIYPAWIYKKKNTIPVIINCQDIWPDVVKTYGINQGFLFSLIKKFSIFLYNKGDLIITSSPGFNDYLVKKCNVDRGKITYLPNFAEEYYLSFKYRNNNDKRFHFLFAGNIGKAQSLQTIVYAIKQLSFFYRERLIVDILGDGSYLNELKDLVEKCGVKENFFFHGRKSNNEIRPFYEEADAFLITLEGNSPVGMTIPSKLQGYMGAGKPVIGAIDGGAREIIEISKCGKCTNAENHEELSIIIADFIDNPTIYKQMGDCGRNYFKDNFSINKYLNDLEKIMEEIK